MDRLFARMLPVLSRYVLGEFLRLFGICMMGFLLVYVLVDFFDRLDVFLKYRASLGAVLRYFLFKIPLIVTQLVPVATLGAVLLSLGNLARHNEITALRACGVSSLQTATPLLVTGVLLGGVTLLWSEVVVPYCADRSRQIEMIEIRNKPLKALLSEYGIWFHGDEGIYNIEHFDARQGTLVGLMVYDFNPGFSLRRLIEIPTAHWQEGRWAWDHAYERTFDETGNVHTRELGASEFSLRDKPADFQVIEKDAEALNFRRLRRHIVDLSRKGLDTTESRVDLHLKLALPLLPLVMMLVGIPMAIRNPRRRPLAASIGAGLMIGFSYWVLLALTVSLGHGGAIPPAVAAWTANGVFAVLGAFLFLSPEG